MAYNLSEKAIAEKYEDLLFTKVMALYAEEESEKILSELGEETADPKAVQKLFDKKERSENLRTLWKYSKKILQFAAMIVFVAVVSVSSVVVASAEVRETVAEAIYHLMIKDYGRYTEVSIGDSTGFIDPEIYDWEGAYAPTYMPEGFVIEELYLQDGNNAVVYYKDDYFIIINQMNNSFNMQMDTENAEVAENIRLHNSNGFLVVKENLTTVIWSEGETIFEVSGNIVTNEIIKIAESLKPVRNTEKLIPTSGYKFVDPENYNFEGAYAPTYIPEGFVLLQKQRFGSQYCVDYRREDGYISFLQAGKDVIFQVNTEGADTIEKILIGESEGLLVSENGNTYLNWSIGNTNFQIYGTCETDEIIKMAQGIKPLGNSASEPEEEYTFVDPEIYDWEGAYAPTYMPEGYSIGEIHLDQPLNAIVYYCGKDYIFINQMDKSYSMQIDTEGAFTETVYIHDTEGLLVVKDVLTTITWNEGKILFEISGTAPTEEIIKVAEGIKALGKTETEEPAEEYKFVDPENYNFEGAYAPTYIPEGFNFVECVVGLDSHSNTYENNEKFVIIEQKNKNYTTHIDTENAQIVKNIIINNCEALFIEKDGLAYITWGYEDTLFFICGNIKSSEIIKVAEGIRPMN